ncbi:MAG: hypothetical protein LIP03_01095 [Bacteroidales bacterium]|nr:hypothetical protein [Bacteroidales bacterium]
MTETSTRTGHQVKTTNDYSKAQPRPKNATIAFIKQFARAYMPVPQMPGLVLN